MEINYGTIMPDMDFRRLTGQLAEKNFFIIDKYGEHAEEKYGFTEHDKSSTSYQVSSPNHGVIMTVGWRSDATAVVRGFEHIIEGIVCETVTELVTKKEWAEPVGQHAVIIHEDFVGFNANISNWGRNQLTYPAQDITMAIMVKNDYEGLRLVFEVTWHCDTIQRKEAIEENMVDLVLKDMGIIQAIFEGRLKLKQFNRDVDDVTIDCHFDAKTESRSECTPDIIKQVRDARKGIV